MYYLNPEHLGNVETDRKAVFDLYCEGRQEERLVIARMLKKNGASIELIEKSTGLTKAQIESLV